MLNVPRGGLFRLTLRSHSVIVLGAFTIPKRRGSPEWHGWQGCFPVGQLAKQFLEARPTHRRKIGLFSGIGVRLEHLGGAMREADQLIISAEDGGLSL